MKWKINSLNEQTYNDIYSTLDKDLILERLSYLLQTPIEGLFNDLDENEIFYLLSTILHNRKIDINKNINHIDEQICDPSILTNADKAAQLLKKYCDNENSLIAIFADYDADGINAGYIAFKGIDSINKGKTALKYPNRSEGYGLNIDWCKELKELKELNNKDILVVTVDNGITKTQEVKYLKDNGIEVLITDHHASQDIVPNCLIVDPCNAHEEQHENTKGLCGAGVIFKVIQLLHKKYNMYDMLDFVPYVAIATITDVMPLTDENLAFIQYGLELMNGKECPIGIKTLLQDNSIDIVTFKDIAWTIGPLLNASGRIASPLDGANVLFADNKDTAIEHSHNLIKINEKRKSITKDAKKDLSKNNFDNDNVCIYINKKYPTGIVGIIAGEASKLFNKPSIVLTLAKDNMYHGSVRSVLGIDILSILLKMQDKGLIENCGGHALACACTINPNKIEEVKEYFNSLDFTSYYELVDNEEEEILEVDEIISLAHLNKTMYVLSNLLPTDDKNVAAPVFGIKDLQVVSYNVSKNNPENLKLVVKQDGRTKTIWAWGFGSKYLNELNCPSVINIAGPVEKCFITGQYVLKIKDIAI